jgi:hypothetical protein
VFHVIGPTRGILSKLAPGLRELSFRGHLPRMRAHLRLHHLDPKPVEEASAASGARPRVVAYGGSPGARLVELRRELSDGEAYRGRSSALAEELQASLVSPRVPLREKAVALRALAKGDATNVKKRIGETSGVSRDEAAWLEAVALEEDETAAIAKLEKRAPDFEP